MARCIPCASKDDIERLLRYIQPFLNHGNQWYRDSKLVISTFAGQDSKFGHGSFERGWTYIKRRLEEVTPVCGLCSYPVLLLNYRLNQVCFIPSFFIDPRRYPSLTFMDGYFNVCSSLLGLFLTTTHKFTPFQWNGGWPIHLTKDSTPSEIKLPSLDTDRHHLHHLGGRGFMAAVSPWFFTVS